MEVFIIGVPKRVTERSLNDYFKEMLHPLGLENWICQKISNKSFAKLHFLNAKDGQRLLDLHGQIKRDEGGYFLVPGATSLTFKGKSLHCRLSNSTDEFALRSLRRTQEIDKTYGKEKETASIRAKADWSSFEKDRRNLLCTSVSCGLWEYVDSQPIFKSYFTLEEPGTITFNKNFMVCTTEAGNRIDISYYSIESIAWHGQPTTAVIFTLREAPRFFTLPQQDELSILLDSLFGDYNPPETKLKRVPVLNDGSGKIVGCCFVYRFLLPKSNKIEHRMRELSHIRGMPPFIQRHITVQEPTNPYIEDFDLLLRHLSPDATDLDFAIKFQIQKLAQNGYLPPNEVIALLPEIENMASQSESAVCVSALRKLFLQIPFAGPDVEVDNFNFENLLELLRKNETLSKRDGIHLKHLMRSENVACVHKAMVTPAGLYLYGPDMETKNRVLRKYSANHDQFLRVQFSDEDGLPVFFNAGTSNEAIYKRFRAVLNEGIHIAGQNFSFLGFSHSSLRAQSCWFMAPFDHNGNRLTDRQLIRGLGNFSQIKSPARCAARIGQAFSDTRDAIYVDPSIVSQIPDVKRHNGRTFSDGIGTISQEALEQIWNGLLVGKKKKPTVLQIRYQGAKGVLALDSRLRGKSIFLRESMIKFPGSDSDDLEICNAGYKPLPLYLNQQMVKILEDMGVDYAFFFNLQNAEVDRLRLATSNTRNASKFLKAHSIGKKIDLSRFVIRLDNLNLPFQDDKFLTDAVEAAVLIELRALKYKARIPVKNGFTLIGIMDETGVLKENEIFCIVEIDGDVRVITGPNGEKVIITRSPALHPGDIQLASAVTVPDDSPLMQLRNCICFSQHGSRDLPSMLSGGDLDGDLYHIIFDSNARVKESFPPAEYSTQRPPDLSREVDRQDMTDFFVNFMETDQLGRISNIHKILADQNIDGVCNPDCVRLAELASTAVDFSKTGIPVNPADISKLKYSPYRPHFMAPGPYVDLVQQRPISFQSYKEKDEDEETATRKYYTSEKILGKLFSSIDESEILRTVQGNGDEQSSDKNIIWRLNRSVLNNLWSYIEHRNLLTGWREYVERARGIRDEYEEALFDIMIEYGPRPQCPVSEIEVFVGNILGKSGAQTKRQRDLSISMKERFETDLSFTVNSIMGKTGYLYDEEAEEDDISSCSTNDRADQTLALSMACLWVALNENSGLWEYGKRGKLRLQSFGYVAAAVCLKETEKAAS